MSDKGSPFLTCMGLAMCEEGVRAGAQGQQAGGRQVYESKYMGRDEIDSILRIQWRSLHNGPPYQEDYYFQVRTPPPPSPCSAQIDAGDPCGLTHGRPPAAQPGRDLRCLRRRCCSTPAG